MPRLARTSLAGAALTLSAGVADAGGIDTQNFSQVERGHYLAIVGDCAACHTLPGSGHDFAGGRPIETPFGKLVAPNITPDPTTGIGAWTDDEFVNALTKGTGRNGTHLYPAMPYTYYTKLTRDDALAIRAYLNTVPAVQNAVNADQLPFPLNVRASMAAWNKLFFESGTFEPIADKSAEWNRGAYLVQGLAHCGMCHTSKNFLGADKTGEALQGYALQGWFAPNITNDARRGLGSWSVDDVVAYLKTGHNRTGAATGPMSETLNLSTSHMDDGDLKAIAVYLKDAPGQEESAASAPDQKAMTIGAQIYADECSGCHATNGKGIAGIFPALSGSPAVQQNDPTSLLHVVLRGARSVGTDEAPTAPAMPASAWVLNDDQVAAVVTYIRNAWGNAAAPVSSGTVSKTRESLVERSD
ncbi:MAG TPA: c-type cytochrome [Xanthobacteraceae bacterium]|nr:c-type cytochrome [Xanthobacteraceae bacterium]